MLIDFIVDIVVCMILISFIANEIKWLLYGINPELLPEQTRLEIEEVKRNAI